ncbi:MAG: secretin and TonB N-terminal domain-containing protein [Bacteroidetes bacterium]|nr:secretin and TonB N-terminal domain-containing protein [Bacteroidota bacterium]
MKFFLISILWSLLVLPLQSAAQTSDSSAFNQRLTMNFKDADLLSILRLLARQNQLNLVANNDVKGRVTVHFNDVTLAEALETILKSNGFDYYIERDIIYVKPVETERSARMITRIFELHYTDAFDMKSAVQSMLSKRGRVEAFSRSQDGTIEQKRSTMMLVCDTESNVATVDSLVHRLDVALDQVMIEVRMYEVTFDNTSDVGVGLPTAITGKINDARNPDDPGAATDYTAIIPLEDKLQNIVMGKLSIERLMFSLNFLKTETNSKLVSNPKILTIDNRKAEISVGTTIPIRTISRSAAGDIIAFTDKNVDVKVSVTPRIHPDSTMTLLIEPLIEDIVGYVGDENNRQPIISTRKARTQVVIKNNESVVIGGLLKESEVDVTFKVWLLSDIPLLGRLFTRKTKEKKKTDLLIFLTPHIIPAIRS